MKRVPYSIGDLNVVCA